MKHFPDDFVWGVATSAFQIEGATKEDGRGESIWDRYCATPGKIVDATNGDVACDHYHRVDEDIEHLKWLGVDSYRFSIGWTRILPTGRGIPNAAGLDFYDRLVDKLLAAGIDPNVTLNHWCMPQALEDAGGWPERETVHAFVEYAEVVTRRLGDRVRRFCTHNEPWCVSVLGYGQGEHAPGDKSWPRALAAAHHLLLSHGLAVQAMRAIAPHAQLGIVLNLAPGEPASPSKADREACRAHDGAFNRWFLDPIYGKGYPADVIADHHAAGHLAAPSLPFVHEGDLAAMATPTDYLGINYYSRAVLRAKVPESENQPQQIFQSNDRTDMGWEVAPNGLYDVLTRVHKDYAPRKIFVTENGCAYATAPGPDGRVRDVERQRYLWTHFEAVRRAIEDGVPLGGFYIWSFMDNFEWAMGYAKRFGIFWVDYATQERIAKDSAHMCRRIIADNALDEVPVEVAS